MQVFSRLETTLAISRRIDSPVVIGNGARSELTLRSQYFAEPPSAQISDTSVSSRSVRRAPSTTYKPKRASRRAVASPMPLLAPVISTTFCVFALFSWVVIRPDLQVILRLWVPPLQQADGFESYCKCISNQ